MARTNLYFKLDVEHEKEEQLERLVAEVEHHLRKLHIVRFVEFSHAVKTADE